MRFIVTCLIGALAACTPMLGCSVQRVNFNKVIAAEDLTFIRPGETTLHYVVKQLGAPEEITAAADQLVAEFKWSTTRSSSLNLGHLLRIVSPVAPPMTLSGTGINIQRLLIVCDEQLVVQSYALGLTEEHATIEFWPF
jgi:hypothetical protein